MKADWSQQEIRIAAHYSQDPEMLNIYREGQTDVYRRVAEELVGHPVEKDSPERQNAKKIVLGNLYGMGVGLYIKNTYKDYGEWLSEETTKEHRAAFFKAFEGYKKWQNERGNCKFVGDDGCTYVYLEWEDRFTTRSVRGRRRVVKPNEDGQPKYTDKINGPIQTSGSDILYVALRRIHEDEGLPSGCHFVLSSHDEVVFEVPDDERGPKAKEVITGHMRAVLEELLSPDLGGPKCVEAHLVADWSQEEKG